LFFQNFNLNIKSLLIILFSSILILFLAFNNSQIFKDRVFETINDVQKFSEEKNTSLGLRVQYAIYSFEIFRENPLIGVGTGDFSDEFKKINKVNNVFITNPHNNYLFVLGQFGILGLISMLYIFFKQITSLDKNSVLMKNLGFGFTIFFMIICIGDSYILGHYTSLMLVFFSSLLYSQDEKI